MNEVAVAQLMNSDLRPYRLPFLRRLSETEPGLALTLYVGQAPPDYGAPAEAPRDVPVRVKSIVNHFWPFGGHRVAWQSGALSILRSPADVIICPEVAHNLTVWVIRVLHRRFGKTLVLTGFFTRTAGTGLITRGRRLMLRWLRRSASAVIAYTENGRRALLADGWPPERVFVSHNTLDTEMLEALSSAVSEQDVSDLRVKLGVGSKRVVLFIGKLIREKHLDVAIRALDQLPEPPTLVVVGDGPERANLEKLAAAQPVVFVGATYDEAQLAKYLALAEFLTLPGRVGLTCVHGFAAGRPCVTTDQSAAPQTPEYEYVDHGHNALVVHDLDPFHHAAAFASLLDDSSLLASLRSGAQDTGRRLRMDSMVSAYAAAVRAARPRT
jgi:2-deoxystreptamine N-acetyl-D-glucosaminyltransferase/2-deoxystreptamine glucosyltransferase